jgi:hypothetical protein
VAKAKLSADQKKLVNSRTAFLVMAVFDSLPNGGVLGLFVTGAAIEGASRFGKSLTRIVYRRFGVA